MDKPITLKKLRETLDLTQPELAKKIDLSKDMIAKLEAGTRDPSFRTLKSLESLDPRLTSASFPPYVSPNKPEEA